MTDHVLRLTGRPPRTIEAFLDEHRRHFAPAPGSPATVPTKKAA